MDNTSSEYFTWIVWKIQFSESYKFWRIGFWMQTIKEHLRHRSSCVPVLHIWKFLRIQIWMFQKFKFCGINKSNICSTDRLKWPFINNSDNYDKAQFFKFKFYNFFNYIKFNVALTVHKVNNTCDAIFVKILSLKTLNLGEICIINFIFAITFNNKWCQHEVNHIAIFILFNDDILF